MKLSYVVHSLIIGLASLPLSSCRVSEAKPPLEQAGGPVVRDERLELTLFVSDPDIVTPIGIAVDARDHVYVLESHTHLPPSDYPGPKGDRIKRFTDRDRDGTADEVEVFADGIEDGMNLAFSPAGELYVVAAREVWALRDHDGDGVSESRTRVLELTRPAQVYDHAGLLGITFSGDGWMYVSRGNTGGQAWRLVGTDGSTLEGYGDGGNIVRARPDGSRLEEVATGFWNPFDLKFDSRGRLLAADNDPDSRGPNRLVHVIAGGDFGYRSLYGGSGIHPYLAWNGEVPGTLRYVAGLGEAPSGLLNADLTAFPTDYRGDALVTIWEESRIVRVRTAPRGVSLAGEAEVVVEGGADFRPVALAADAQGNVYITDWVVRAYPNHGSGRIWRLSAKREAETLHPRTAFAPPEPDAGERTLRVIESAGSSGDFDRLRGALTSSDPFVRAAAVHALARPAFRSRLLEAIDDADADVRLGALLALRRSPPAEPEPIAHRLLSDPDARVRQMALIWIGSAGMTSLRPELERAITTGSPSPALFEVYLATVEQTAPEFVRAYRSREQRYAKDLVQRLPPRFLESFVADASQPAELRAVALLHLPDPAEHRELLTELARAGATPELRVEAIRSLAFAGGAESGESARALVAIARNRAEPVRLRTEALSALARNPALPASEAVRLLDDPEPEVRLEAARYLHAIPLDPAVRQALAARRASMEHGGGDDALLQQLTSLLGAAAEGKPSSAEEWAAALLRGGDAARGRRVFFSPRSTCAQCHTFERRGGDLGPDLTHVGRSKTREQLVRAILQPSEEISPEYQGWYIRTPDGQTHYGRQIDIGERGAELYMLPGRFATFDEVTEYGTVDRSLMPEGLHQLLTVAELRDLIAFLE